MGRWRGNKREDRICKLCGEGIEDEKHFLMICTKLDLHRVWMREEENLENSNEDEKSDIILKSYKIIGTHNKRDRKLHRNIQIQLDRLQL